MQIEVTIINITGSSPYDLYLCDSSANQCIYIDTFDMTPHKFILPTPFNNPNNYSKVKVIDNNGCSIIKSF
jgi:hypothetical protein